VPSLVTILNTVSPILAFSLDFCLLFLALRKRTRAQLTFLLVYAVFNTPRDIGTYWISHTPYFKAHWFSYSYWAAAFLLSFIRLAIICEICRRVLRRYVAVWYFASRFLVLLIGVFLLWIAHSAVHNAGSFRNLVLTANQQVSVMQAVVLLVVVAIGVYYHIHISRFYSLILTASCIYSALELTNSELGRYIKMPTNSAFDFIQRFCFLGMEAVWCWAMWRWSDVPARAPENISQDFYDDYSSGIHTRLRALNDRLTRLIR
jgi:hypothetical protein